MEDSYRLSIIIPVYNLEKYIGHCIDSVVGYEELSLEIILIDDGSTDDSPRLCDEYADRYPQIRVVHKANEGASTARNTGMQMALGTYLMFIDGDDYLEVNALRIIFPELDGETELFTFHYYEYYEEDNSKISVKHLELPGLFDKKGNITREVFYSVPALPMPWLYIIQRKYMIRHSLYMKAGILDEDEEWSARVFANLKTAKILNLYAYCYRRNRTDSLTYERSYDNLLADLAIIKLLKKEEKQAKYDRRQRHILNNKSRELLKRTLQERTLLDLEQQKEIVEQQKEIVKQQKEIVKQQKEILKQQNNLRKVLIRGSRADLATYLLSLVVGLDKAWKLVQRIVNLKAKHKH